MRAPAWNSLCMTAWAVLAAADLRASVPMAIEFRGEYLAYSYDHNYIFGYSVKFSLAGYEVRCRYLKANVSTRSFYAFGNVSLKNGEEYLTGDELFFDPKEKWGLLASYGESVKVVRLGAAGEDRVLTSAIPPEEVTLEKVKRSFVYAVSREIELSESFDVVGYEVTVFLEGMESLSIKKLNLSSGLQAKKAGFSLDKIWYSRYQGIYGRASYNYKKDNKVDTNTRLQYEERSILKDYQGPERQADLMTSTVFNLKARNDLGFLGNYNSSGLWNTNLWLRREWSEGVQTTLDFSYDKPVRYRGEAWFGFQAAVNTKSLGNLALATKYETRDQFIGSFNYGLTFLRDFHFSASSSFSKVSFGSSSEFSKILTGDLRIAHSSRLFNLATDYYLNHDLVGRQRLSQPQLDVGLNPFSFYGGLLSAGIRNLFIYNYWRTGETTRAVYSNNTIFNLSTKDIPLQKTLTMNFQLVLEQFFEKEARNFTSGGFIVSAQKEVLPGFYLQGYYSSQSRRRTRKWLIEGTNSQDLSMMLKLDRDDSLSSWISFSFDPEVRQWRESFADISLKLVKNWSFHALLDYDFLLKRMNNTDLYLVRDAGRFQLRFVWRSLTKQFLAEIIPR